MKNSKSSPPTTSSRSPEIRRGLSLKLGLMTALLLAGTAGTVVYTANTVQGLELDGHHIDKAGAQRMLTQKLAKCVMEARLGNAERLEEVASIEATFSEVLAGLQQGSAELELRPAETEVIRAALNDVTTLWVPFQEQLQVIHDQWPDLARKVNQVADSNVAIFDEANALVTAFGAAGIDSKTVSCSGRLRAISQRSAKAVLRYASTGEQTSRNEGLKFLALQDRIIAGLLEGDAELGLTRIKAPKLRAQIEEFRGHWSTYSTAAATVLNEADQAMAAVEYVAANNVPMLKTMNAAVQEMSKHSKSKVSSMVQRQFYLLAILVAAGSVLSFMLIHNITRPLKEVIGRVEKIAGGVLSQEPMALKGSDEVTALGRIFNQMLANLNTTVASVREVSGGNDAATFTAQSDKDELAGALNEMTSSLKAAGERRAQQSLKESEDKARAEAAQAAEQTAREQELHERELRAAEELASKVDLLLSSVAAAANGDLTHSQGVEGADAIGQLGSGLRSFMDDLCARVGDIRTSSNKVASAAGDVNRVSSEIQSNAAQTSERARAIAESASQVSEHIQSVAAAAEEFDASINEISRNTTSAATVASEALEIAQSTSASIADLSAKSDEVGQVIKIISGIAEQTNLLALNATIEAARAGESGKGFSVVASEVKNLAAETELATKDVAVSIAAIQSSIGGAQTGIAEINEVIARINELQSSVAAAVEEQTAVTAEIGQSASRSASASRDLQHSVEEVATLASATEHEVASSRRSAEDLSTMAGELDGMVSHYQVEA